MILIAYDGSEDARLAVERAGRYFAGQNATVLSVWQPFVETVTRAGFGAGLGTTGIDYDAVDHASEEAARQQAEQGAAAAREAGLIAEPKAVALDSTVAQAILAEARSASAEVIVIGSRGLTGVKSLLLGSVSNAVVHHADRPVMVVPAERSSG